MSEKKFQNNLKGHFSGTLMKVEESETPNGKKVKNCEVLMSVGEGEKAMLTNVKFSVFEGSGMFNNPLLDSKGFNQNIENGGKRPFINVKGANMESYPSGEYPNLQAVFTKNTQINKVEKGMTGFKNQAYMSNSFINSIGKSEQGFFVNLLHKATEKVNREWVPNKNQPNDIQISIFIKADTNSTEGIQLNQEGKIDKISFVKNNEGRGYVLDTSNNAQFIGIGDRVSVNVSFPYKTTAQNYNSNSGEEKSNVTMHTSFREGGITVKQTREQREEKSYSQESPSQNTPKQESPKQETQKPSSGSPSGDYPF